MYDNIALIRDVARASIVKHWARRSGITEGPVFVGFVSQANPPPNSLAVIGIGPDDNGEARTERNDHGGLSAPTLRFDGYNPITPCGITLRSTYA